MRTLLIGGGGQLGTELIAAANGRFKIIVPERGELDVTDSRAVGRAMDGAAVELLINCAAFHDLEACENDPGLALQVNATAVSELAHLCRHQSVRLLTFSTDYVFPGDQKTPYDENARPYPLQAYGASKRAGELAALEAWGEGTYIIRTCGLYGPQGSRSRGGNFIAKRLAEAATAEVLEVGSDLICTPTYAADLAAAVLDLMAVPGLDPGVYHLTNEGQCSWAEFTRAGFEAAGVKTRIKAIDRGGDYGPVKRPPYSVLANKRARALGITLPSWPDALERYLGRYLAASTAS